MKRTADEYTAEVHVKNVLAYYDFVLNHHKNLPPTGIEPVLVE